MTSKPHDFEILSRVIANIEKLGKKSLVVFDLDSTLFDVSPRLKEIINRFAELPETQKNFPEAISSLKTVQFMREDWGIKNALIRAGLDGDHPEFKMAIKDFWRKSFFSNDLLKYDIPYDGACEFVNHCHELGADIIYLTGRDVLRMGTGTAEGLKQHGFPLNETTAKLALKPQAGMDDAEFKKDFFAAIPHDRYEKIWFFENEPVNINLVQTHLDHIEIVFFHSTHQGVENAPQTIPWIQHYLSGKDTKVPKS